MATNTTNYNLKKPAPEDYYNIQDANDNMDKIDIELKNVNDKADGAIQKNLGTAADQVMVSSGVGAWIVKSLAQFKAWLGLGSAAYTESSAYATAAQGTTADDTADALNVHKADNVIDAGGVHGLKIESGIWTGVLAGTIEAGNNVYFEQTMNYYKVNNLIFISGRITITTKDVSMNGSVIMSGLPFANSGGSQAATSIALSKIYGVTLAAGRSLNAQISPTSSSITFFTSGSNSTMNLGAGDIADGTSLTIMGLYRI